MKKYDSADQLARSFVDGDFQLDPYVQVGGINFRFGVQSDTTIAETIAGKRPVAVYESENNTQLVLFWVAQGNNVVPGGVVSTDSSITQIATEQLVVEMDGEKITIRPDQLVGDIAMVKFVSLSSPKELQGKVDTGATISSLHADHYKINGNTVTFTCQPLGNNSVTVPLKTQHAVRSPDGGTHYRPVITMNVKVNGKLINNVEFNLNDRGNMDQPVLIGQNLLQAGKFYVDPTKKESFELDWSNLDQLIEACEVDAAARVDENAVAELYAKMLQGNINFSDLVRHIKSELTKTDIEY